MNHYDPDIAPVAAAWLSLDEDERIELVMNFHEQYDDNLPNVQVHAVFHVIVENQLAMEVEGVPEAMSRLLRQGLDRHDAIHAIGAVLAEDTFKLLKGEEDGTDRPHYRRRLAKLTAKRWRKGQY